MRNLTRRHLLCASATVALTGVGLGLGLGYVEARTIEVTRLKMGIGSKIAFLVDAHIHDFNEVEERVIGLVKDEKPDIIMLGGDIVDELTTDMRAVVKFISGLKGREKFAVMGNHDYWSGKAKDLDRILRDNEFDLLYDSSASSSAGKIYGLDWRENRKYPPLNAQGIVLVHDPNSAPSISGKCLILCGHTHGGLVFAGVSLYSNSIYTRGFYEIMIPEGTTLYVSRGLGQMIQFRPTSPLELIIVE